MVSWQASAVFSVCNHDGLVQEAVIVLMRVLVVRLSFATEHVTGAKGVETMRTGGTEAHGTLCTDTDGLNL